MPDYLDILACDAKETVNEGYYIVSTRNVEPKISLRKAILDSKRNAVITEVKAASPSRGDIRTNFDAAEVAKAMKAGGATAISVLTEPKHFSGSLNNLTKVREAVGLPIIMKDIIISPVQLEAAAKTGANAILLIEAVFERGYCELGLEEMISQAHTRNLEVLLETHNEKEFQSATKTDADLVGINNRDLRTLEVNVRITQKILQNNESGGKVVVTESGIMTASDLIFLRKCGAQAFLIGSSIMTANNIEKTVKEFVAAH